MNGGGCSTTRIWRPPSSTASWSADGSFASMDPRDELVISSWRTPCQAVPNGSEYLEYVAQNFRNPQPALFCAEAYHERPGHVVVSRCLRWPKAVSGVLK